MIDKWMIRAGSCYIDMNQIAIYQRISPTDIRVWLVNGKDSAIEIHAVEERFLDNIEQAMCKNWNIEYGKMSFA